MDFIGAVADPQQAAPGQRLMDGVSSEPPIAPNTCMARSAIRCSMAGTATLISETSRQASWCPA
jgi:hypothetical protein